jgi:hypothetical protein
MTKTIKKVISQNSQPLHKSFLCGRGGRVIRSKTKTEPRIIKPAVAKNLTTLMFAEKRVAMKSMKKTSPSRKKMLPNDIQ